MIDIRVATVGQLGIVFKTTNTRHITQIKYAYVDYDFVRFFRYTYYRKIRAKTSAAGFFTNPFAVSNCCRQSFTSVRPWHRRPGALYRSKSILSQTSLTDPWTSSGKDPSKYFSRAITSTETFWVGARRTIRTRTILPSKH